MQVVVLKQAQPELKGIPRDVLIDIFSLFDDLAEGKSLSLPISRPLPSIGKGLHELRLSGRAGEYRVFYVFKVKDAIYVLHASMKKRQALSKQTAGLLKLRMKGILS